MDKSNSRQEEIKSLKWANYVNREKREFREKFPEILFFDLTADKKYEGKIQKNCSLDKKPQIKHKHSLHKTIEAIRSLETKTEHLSSYYVIITNTKEGSLPYLILLMGDFWRNFDEIMNFINFSNESSYIWFVLSGLETDFGFSVFEDEYGYDSIDWYGLQEN